MYVPATSRRLVTAHVVPALLAACAGSGDVGRGGTRGDTTPASTSAVAAASAPATTTSLSVEAPRELFGTCDASAAVALGTGPIVVASDEDDTLRVYDLERADSLPTQKVSLDALLDPVSKDGEADLEGAARVADTIYWIGSQGNNKSAKGRPRRRVVVATVVRFTGGRFELVPAGRAYASLRDDLLASPLLSEYGLANAAKLAPEPAGLNVEGFASARSGDRLLVGFRSPRPEEKALVVGVRIGDALRTPSARMTVTDATTLELGGYGIRDLAPISDAAFLIAAGPAGDDGTTRMYQWIPAAEEGTLRQVAMTGFDTTMTIEAIAVPAGRSNRVLLAADDGGRRLGAQSCKDAPPARRRFRAAWATLAAGS